MTPLDWRARARQALEGAGETRCFVRFAPVGEEALFATDAETEAALVQAGFCIRARRGRICFFDPPDDWYRALAGMIPEEKECGDEREVRLLGLCRRLGGVQAAEGAYTSQGRALLRETARGCFFSGRPLKKTVASLRAQAAVLQRRGDTSAFEAAAALAAAACGMHHQHNAKEQQQR